MTHILVVLDDLQEENLSRIAGAVEGWATWEMLPSSAPPEDFRRRLNKSDILIGWPEPSWLQDSPLKLVLLPSHGFEPYLDLGLENKPDFRLCNARGAYSISVAEHCIALVMALARNIPQHARDQREHRWQPYGAYREVTGSSACIIGLGSVGSEIATRCLGLGMLVSGVDIAGVQPPAGVGRMYPPSEIHEAVSPADHVIGIVPGGASNRAMFNRDFFAAMKPGAFFYNVGRGASVDEAALVEALESGHVAGAGLDVFVEEPLPATSRLWDFDNVVITPHVAGQSVKWDTRLTDQIVANLTSFKEGRSLHNQVIPSSTG